MRTTVDLDQESYRLAKAVASMKQISLGKVLAEAIIGQFGTPEQDGELIFAKSSAGFTIVVSGPPATAEDVADLEDE